MADFSRLPFFNGSRDENPDIPNLSEEIISQPFLDYGLVLQPGVHLHWALPDALTHGSDETASPEGSGFPPAPNRWLVTRSRSGAVQMQWVVESNAIFQPEDGVTDPGVSYPYAMEPGRPSGLLGRKFSLADWRMHQGQAAGLIHYMDESRLTAFGYGEPAFSAFYPNCYSVFGFHDPDIVDPNDFAGLTYDVIGWYNDPAQDPLHPYAQGQPGEDYTSAIANARKWALSAAIKNGSQTRPDPSDPAPAVSLYYARIHCQVPPAGNPAPPKTRLAIGNTAGEALSTLLSGQIAGQLMPHDPAAAAKARPIIEDQLEALGLYDGLSHLKLDTGAKFREARHEKSFTAYSGGSLWVLRPESQAQPSQSPGPATQRSQVRLPNRPDIARLLNRLNAYQQEYDTLWLVITSFRQKLFAYWYKYMICAYPPPDSYDRYPNADEVMAFIQRDVLAQLHDWNPNADPPENVMRIVPDALGQPTPIVGGAGAIRYRAQRLSDAILALLDSPDLAAYQLVQADEIGNWKTLLARLADLTTSPELANINQAAQLQDDLNKDQKALVVYFLNNLLLTQNLYALFTRSDVDARLSNDARGRRTDASNHSGQGTPRYIWLRFNRLLLEAYFPECISHRPNMLLEQAPAPRYWQPNDPVVLVAGDLAKPTHRHGADGRLRPDGLLDCCVLSLSGGSIADQFNDLRAAIDLLEPAGGIGFHTWTEQPWNPILLEWEVAYTPAGVDPRAWSENPYYPPDFISSQYGLQENTINLQPRPGVAGVPGAAARYVGRSLLTPYAKAQLDRRIDAYLKKQKAKHDANPTRKPKIPPYGADPVQMVTRARELVNSTYILAQSLGGFNEALQMKKFTLQLPIDDPIGFAEYRAFTDEVRKHAAPVMHPHFAPQPHDDFLPTRAGGFSLLRLRLIDTFGQARELPLDDVTVCTTLASPTGLHMAELPPRLAQPARLNFRWLAALPDENGADEIEMNSNPDSSPVCGWLAANNLDGSVMVFNDEGQALGVITAAGKWELAPGRDLTDPGLEIDPHLQAVLDTIRKGSGFSVAQFVDAMEAALENIDPADFAHHESLALLTGRPVAVVRATLSLALQGLPAEDQDWIVFRKILQRTDNDAADFIGNIRFPVRLGEYRQLNDGLVGFWVEDGPPESPLGEPLYISDSLRVVWTDAGRAALAQPGEWSDPQVYARISVLVEEGRSVIRKQSVLACCGAEMWDHFVTEGWVQPIPSTDGIVIYADDPDRHLTTSTAAAPLKLTLLVDPRGWVHATSGILPTKAIRIPPEHYRHALKRIEVSFLTTPLLSPQGTIQLPLPQEAGHAWAWITREHQAWTAPTPIEAPDETAILTSPVEIRDGWIKLEPAE